MSPGFWMLRCLVWIGAALAIADPAMVQRIASLTGIATGTNLVLYLFVLGFLVQHLSPQEVTGFRPNKYQVLSW